MAHCPVCELPEQVLDAVDAALRDGVPLQQLSERSGIPKTTLWRHSKHQDSATAPLDTKSTPIEPLAVIPKAKTPAAVVKSPPEPPLDREAKRARAEERLEMLFAESIEGLTDCKKPMTIERGGTVMQIPGDLRARAAFVRVAQGVVDVAAKISGLYEPQQALPTNMYFSSVIVLPKAEHVEQNLPGPVVDALPEPET